MTDDSPSRRAPLPWRVADVRAVIDETPRVRTLVLQVPDWPGHLAGQHVDVRLTGDDGYQAQRSYSIASEPEAADLRLTIERLDEGEVSPYLAIDVRAGDRFALRGPIGGHFVWTTAMGGPLMLVAGGSGIVPLMAMLRHRAAQRAARISAGARDGADADAKAHAATAAAGADIPTRLIYSSRTLDDIIYREELGRLAASDPSLAIMHTLTRQQPAGWTGGLRRVDREMLATAGIPADARPRIFICGSTPFVESAAQLLLDLGHDAGRIKTERFGPTGR